MDDKVAIGVEIRNSIKEGDLNKFISLVGSDQERLRMVTPFGTWLHVASNLGQLEIAKHVIDQGIDVNQPGGIKKGGALNEAAGNGHLEIARCLIEHGAKLDVSAPEKNPLFSAIINSHFDIVKLLVESGIDLTIEYRKGRDAIGFARERRATKIADYLAGLRDRHVQTEGADVDAKQQKKLNLEIRAAIEAGDLEKVVALIGTDKKWLETMTVFGSWLHVAADKGQLEIVKKLVALGLDVNLRGGIAEGTAIHEAAANSHTEVVRYLISCGAELNADGPEKNPLFAAIYEGNLDIVKLLVDAGIDLQPKYRKGRDPVSFALERGQTKIAEYLGALQSSSAPKPAVPVGNPKTVDFGEVQKRIVHAVRQVVDWLRSDLPDEEFYALALYTVEDCIGVTASLNSERAYTAKRAAALADKQQHKWLKEHGIGLEESILGDARWSPYAWEYECAGSGAFQPVDELINQQGQAIYDEDDPQGFEKFQAGVLSAMVLALKELDDAKYFGKGAARKKLTLFCSVPDSELALWLEADSARRLNSAALFKVFAKERIAWIVGDTEPEPDEVHPLYLARVESGA